MVGAGPILSRANRLPKRPARDTYSSIAEKNPFADEEDDPFPNFRNVEVGRAA